MDVLRNPHEEQQSALMNRIIVNVEKLNEAMLELNRAVNEINHHNTNVTLVSQMWSNYNRNVLFNLESTRSLNDPV